MQETARKKRLSEKLDELLAETAGEVAPANAAPAVNVSGGTVFVGNGNVHNVYNVRPRITVVQTGNGVLDGHQKRRLLDLRDQIAAASRYVDAQAVTPGGVMRRLNQHMRVNSYAEIPADEFGQAETYLVRWRARLEGMPGATRSPGWRDRRIRAIHTRCRELNAEGRRFAYMRKRFGKTSLMDLSNEEVDQVYRAVMDWKAEE
ncbi:hypothetical protein [Ralstonia solanacearum]|uniref:hypothetical protein n=1 Tax=Ralstonia solanacearum TaxID=305 RepID=UPI00168BE6AD|nr:hypothetical protein [Ralstonia solanacearum]QNT25332.1 hypothetical protein C2I38_25055 [Ralstonia solanacearum]QNT62979.1 hypothetical protein C2L97_25100 [Ralstonia solanacearum]